MTDNPLKRPGSYVDDSPEQLLYEERHCAIGRPVTTAFWSGIGLALVGVLLAMVSGYSSFYIATIMGGVVVAYAVLFFVALRPFGIRITTKRVIVGAIAFSDGRDVAAGTRRDGTVPPRRWVYSCDWEGIRSIVIATGAGEAKRLFDESRDRTNLSSTGVVPNKWSTPLGILRVPGAPTMLAVRVDPDVAQYPRARQKRRKFWTESPVLGVPTRHPKKLRQALASFPRADSITNEITYTAKRPSY